MNEKKTVEVPGVIVRSAKGRDRFRAFAVIDTDPENMTAPLVIADGRLHPLRQRKHKNPKHLELLAVPVESDRKILLESGDDGKIAEICEMAEKRFVNPKNGLDKQVPKDL